MRQLSVLLGCVALIAAGLAAPAAGRTVYRDPPGYKGITRAPSGRPLPDPTPRPQPPIALSDAGTFPDVLVDAAGTAHVVFNEDRGDAADVVVYCRIKRATSGCDARSDLEWQKDYGAGDGPQYNIGGPPKIVQVGQLLVVFSHRYPTGSTKPDGTTSSSTVVAWTSADGGTLWSRPEIVGKWNLGQLVVVGAEDNPTVLNLGVDPLCDAPGPAAACIEAFPSGQYSGAAGNLSSAKDDNYYENLTLDEQGRPVLATEDLGYDTHIRRWTGAGSPIDPATWSAPTTIGADQISLAGGPAGVYLMGKPKTGYGPYAVSRLNPSGDQYAARRSREDQPGLRRGARPAAPGPDGRLLAAWQQDQKGLQLITTGGRAGAVANFNPVQQVADGAANGQVSLGATADGGGFVAYNHTGGINGPGQVAIAGVGARTPTGVKGVSGADGGGVTAGGAGTSGSCRELSFGKFTAQAAGGCLLKGTGSHADEYVTGGELNLWGVRIIPEGSTKIIINPKTLELNTTGSVKVVVTAPAPIGDVVLFRGELHRDLSKVVPGTDLFEFPTGLFKANVFGFDVSADIKVRLEKDGVHIPVDLKLPPALGGFSGHAELFADQKTGLHVTSLHIHIGPIALGALVINTIDLDYSGVADTWAGDGSITIAGAGTLDITARFVMGNFNEATLKFTPGTPIPIGPFVYLLEVGGGFKVDPVTINANATIGAGATVAGRSPVEVHGDFTMTFPKQGPADFRLKGTVGVFLFQLADGSLDFQSDGYAAFRGHAGVDLGPLSIDAKMDGFVDATTGNYGAGLDGRVALCVKQPLEICASATTAAAVSNKGFAVCVRFNPPDPFGGFEAGLTYPWADFKPIFVYSPYLFGVSLVAHVGGCHTDEYRVPPPRARAAQAGATVVDVPAGLPSETILVAGTDGQPQITVAGPGGETLTSGQPSGAGTIFTAEGVNAAYVQLKAPKAGAWTITALPGSPAIAQVMQADGYAPASITGKLGGRGRARTIRYAIAHGGHGQQVSFREHGAFGTKELGAASRASGTLRFAPADAKGGKRTVEAVVSRNGLITDIHRIATYTAPGPVKPGAVSRLKVKRSGTNLTVSWRGARGATRYAVLLHGAHGTRLGRLVTARTHRTRFAAVRRDERVTVTVQALSAKLRRGPTRKVISRTR